MEYDRLIQNLSNIETQMLQAAERAGVDVVVDSCKALAKAAADAKFCLKEYVEPWNCPDCGHVRKIPHDPKNPGQCPICLNPNMSPYGYLEQRRMDGQLRSTLQCVQWYAKQPNGEVATRCLKGLAKAGSVNAPNSCVQSDG